MAEPSDRAVEHEHSDADPHLIAWLAAGTAAFLVLSPCVLQILFPEALHRRVVVGNRMDVPAPRLQIDPKSDLAALRQAEAKRLSSYGWADPDRKTIHIPLERALTLTLERGLADWPKP
jgi:hypothetical protein